MAKEKLVIIIEGDTKSAVAAIKATGAEFKKFVKNVDGHAARLKSAGLKMSLAITAPLVLLGKQALDSAKDFDEAMRNVNSIARMSEEEFRKMAQDIIDLSMKFPQSAKVLAEGLYDIASSGFAGAKGLKILRAAAMAASAGLTTTAVSAKGITAVLNAYNMTAEDAAEVSDIMFATVDKGVITFEELSESIGEVLSTGYLANIKFEELSGALGYMTTKGIGAAEATTSLNRLILSFIDPSEDLAKVLNDAGYETGELALQQLGLIGAMDLVEQATGGNVTQLNNMFVEMRALRAVSALLGSGMDSLSGYMQTFGNTSGATMIALTEQQKSFAYEFEIFKNSIQALTMEIGNELIPIFQEVIESVKPAIEWFKNLNDEQKEMVVKLGLVAAAAGPVFLILGNLVTVVKSLTTGIIALNVATKGALATVAPLITGYIALVAIAVSVSKGLSSVTMGFYDAAKGARSWLSVLTELVQVITLYPPYYGKLIGKAFGGTSKQSGGMIFGNQFASDLNIPLVKGEAVLPAPVVQAIKEGRGSFAGIDASGGGDITININNPVVREEQDIPKIAEAVSQELHYATQRDQRGGGYR